MRSLTLPPALPRALPMMSKAIKTRMAPPTILRMNLMGRLLEIELVALVGRVD